MYVQPQTILCIWQCFVKLFQIKSLPRIHCMHSILASQSYQTSIHEQEVICIMTSFARRMHGQYEGFIAKTSTIKSTKGADASVDFCMHTVYSDSTGTYLLSHCLQSKGRFTIYAWASVATGSAYKMIWTRVATFRVRWNRNQFYSSVRDARPNHFVFFFFWLMVPEEVNV